MAAGILGTVIMTVVDWVIMVNISILNATAIIAFIVYQKNIKSRLNEVEHETYTNTRILEFNSNIREGNSEAMSQLIDDCQTINDTLAIQTDTNNELTTKFNIITRDLEKINQKLKELELDIKT
jgi:uncharacterized membrane protein YhiD involved in acid resistance